MVMTSYPKVGGSTTDAQFSEMFNSITGSGVRDTTGLAVTADSSGLNVKMAAGFAIVAGCAFKSDAVETFTIPANSSGATRVDTLVLARDYTAASTVLPKLKAGPSGGAAPSLTQNVTGLWEEPLANIIVANGAATIVPANVTDRRRLLATNVQSFTKGVRPTGRLALFGFNDATGKWEGFDGTSWVSLLDANAIVVSSSRPANPQPNQIHLY